MGRRVLCEQFAHVCGKKGVAMETSRNWNWLVEAIAGGAMVVEGG